MMSDHFEPCPWCGPKTGCLMTLGPEKDMSGKPFWQVHCFECGATGPAARSNDAALNKWNKKARV